MCLIVDANRLADFETQAPTAGVLAILEWLTEDGALILGGQLSIELSRLPKIARLFTEFVRRGQARVMPDSKVRPKTQEIANSGLCSSDDPHILALACVSGARTLYTEDADLMNDFRNERLVPRPKGRIYRNAGHSHLLQHTASCGVRVVRPQRPRDRQSGRR